MGKDSFRTLRKQLDGIVPGEVRILGTVSS
jgi:hypothetical protein